VDGVLGWVGPIAMLAILVATLVALRDEARATETGGLPAATG
jgi:hypothetical protein